jgi:hypothetical protein
MFLDIPSAMEALTLRIAIISSGFMVVVTRFWNEWKVGFYSDSANNLGGGERIISSCRRTKCCPDKVGSSSF